MMGGTDVTADAVISQLLDMGFEFAKALEALDAVGPVLNDAVDFILNDSCNKNTYKKSQHAFTSSSKTQNCFSEENAKSSQSLCRMKQSHITDHSPSYFRDKRDISPSPSKPSFPGIKKEEQVSIDGNNQLQVGPFPFWMDCHSHMLSKELGLNLQQNESFQYQQDPQFNNTDGQGMVLNWEQKVGDALQKHFGFSSLKGFQKEAIKAWLTNKDCLILAATGSGKSLCFQIPALLSGKVVVVISPLISLMHDQCLKLAKYGISACFLGSGQPDSTVEQKAMNGVYRIVYVCPETVFRLIEPLKCLAENNMIALFAIDEVHCISKWGHDFRPNYRRLSVLREKFRASHIKSLRFDIPLMALTATATLSVREDVMKSLLMSKETKVVLTSFFRPNLRFSVKHSRTSLASSYDKDFHDLVNIYVTSRMNYSKGKTKNFNVREDDFNCPSSSSGASSDDDCTSESDNYCSDDNYSSASSSDGDCAFPCGDELTVDYLEDELDTPYSADDLDVSCAEFLESGPHKNTEHFEVTQPDSLESLGLGPTIIYVPTRKETTKLAEYFCKSGVKAAAYHAKLPKAHLRRVHEDFHQNLIEVVVATIAFGMGIDKSNVRRIIHYGWPQSLEAYYQEAGRAGRDGKLSDCILYADFWKCPTLLPSQRSEEQTRIAYKMLSDCFRYGMNTATCRAKILVKYFGEEFNEGGCHLCDICISGPPPKQSLTVEVHAFLHTLKAQCAYMGETSFGFASNSGAIYIESSRKKLLARPNFMDVINRIREQHPKFVASDRLWWRGLARILEDMGFIKEADDQVRVSIKYPELSMLGMNFLNSHEEGSFYAHPYADMLLSKKNKPYSSFSEWGKGWADPKIRQQRLQGSWGKGWADPKIRQQRLQGSKRRARKTRTRKAKKSKRNCKDLSTVRGRLAAKLSKFK